MTLEVGEYVYSKSLNKAIKINNKNLITFKEDPDKVKIELSHARMLYNIPKEYSINTVASFKFGDIICSTKNIKDSNCIFFQANSHDVRIYSGRDKVYLRLKFKKKSI